MTEEKTYLSNELCQIFGISKSTLFRWEKDNIIPAPTRDMNNRRLYSSKHILAIHRHNVKKLYNTAAGSEDQNRIQAAHEELSLIKYIYEGDSFGLTELQEIGRKGNLSDKTLKQLLQTAIDKYDIGDPILINILQFVITQIEKPESEPQEDR